MEQTAIEKLRALLGVVAERPASVGKVSKKGTSVKLTTPLELGAGLVVTGMATAGRMVGLDPEGRVVRHRSFRGHQVVTEVVAAEVRDAIAVVRSAGLKVG